MITRKTSQASTTCFKNKGSIRALRPLHMAEDLSWNYGQDVVVYDVREKTPFVSYYIVATAQNEHRLRSLLQSAKETIYDNYYELRHTEGKNGSEWILVDAGEVIIQLFTPAERRRVSFDRLYEDCPHKVVKATKEPTFRRRKRIVREY